MIVCSINLNKRMTKLSKDAYFKRWLEDNKIDIILIQEYSKKEIDVEVFHNYKFLNGNNDVSIWIHKSISMDNIKSEFREGFLMLKVNFISIINIHLNAYTARNRAKELEILLRILLDSRSVPLLLTGDFNIAPNLEDGKYGESYSKFNSKVDRYPLKKLINELNLIDMTSDSREYTIERTHLNKELAFRCDLALVSDFLSRDIEIKYDHSVRTFRSFTDHSAILLDVPVSLCSKSEGEYVPSKTAISRKTPSTIARTICEKILPAYPHLNSILDFGCGYGKDVEFYLEQGLFAEGYDNHEKFGVSSKPIKTYDCVTLTFVLNVLSNPAERIEILKEAATYLNENGYLVVSTRSRKEIDKHATNNGWVRYHDGYWSSLSKKTVQKGLDFEDLVLLAKASGLSLVSSMPKIKNNTQSSLIILEKESKEIG